MNRNEELYNILVEKDLNKLKKLDDIAFRLVNTESKYNSLCAAVKTNNLEIVKYIHMNGGIVNNEIDLYSYDCSNSLYYAILMENLDIIKYIIKIGGLIINYDCVYNSMRNAIKTNNLKIINYIYENGGYITIANITYAIYKKVNVEIFDYLIKNSLILKMLYIDENIMNDVLETINIEYVKILIKYKIPIHAQNIYYSINNYKIDINIINILLEKYNIQREYVLSYDIFYYAIQRNDFDIIKLVFLYGGNINNNYMNQNSLNCAIANQNIKAIKFLLKNGAIILNNNNEYNTFNKAILTNNIEIVKIIIQYNPIYNYDNTIHNTLLNAFNTKDMKIFEYIVALQPHYVENIFQHLFNKEKLYNIVQSVNKKLYKKILCDKVLTKLYKDVNINIIKFLYTPKKYINWHKIR